MRKNNRERILKIARELLPKYGYNGVSIRAIARRAKLTTGAIYFHFNSKKEIYRTICFECINMLVAKFNEGITSRKTPSQKLISTFDSYIDFFYKHRDYYNILMEYKANFEPEDKKENFEMMKKMHDMNILMEETIRIGIKDGVFRKVDARMLAILLGALAEGMLQLKKLGMFEYLKISDVDFRRFMSDITGRGILKRQG
jgi:AcrR family transcriptional regulator